jgi:protein-tyrosine phosphatase
MFSFFKKESKRRSVDLSGLRADMHSHLLPGIDDGAQTVEDSITLITGLKELGYKKLVTTPHILSDIYPNSPDTINAAFKVLKSRWPSALDDIELGTAAEYFLDDFFDTSLEKGSGMLTVSGNMLLVEFSFVSPPLNLKDRLFDMQIKGYQPILAHPERYVYFARNRTFFDELKSTGCLFQVNLLSFAGYYGKASLELAHYLADKKYIDLLGTDMHHVRHLDTLKNSGQIMDVVNKLLDSGSILNPQL